MPGIGDPTVVGWLTVVAYFVAAVGCARAALSATRPERRFWVGLAVALALLGVNKQLDLQSWFTELARDLLRAQGFYGVRRYAQLAFIAGLGLGAIAGMVGLWYTTRSFGTSVRWALLGMVALCAFVIVRASSFHHIDGLLGSALGGLRYNWLLELGGIGTIAFAAQRARRHHDSGGSRRTPERRRLDGPRASR